MPRPYRQKWRGRAIAQRMRMRVPRLAQAILFLLLKNLQCVRLRSLEAHGHSMYAHRCHRESLICSTLKHRSRRLAMSRGSGGGPIGRRYSGRAQPSLT